MLASAAAVAEEASASKGTEGGGGPQAAGEGGGIGGGAAPVSPSSSSARPLGPPRPPYRDMTAAEREALRRAMRAKGLPVVAAEGKAGERAQEKAEGAKPRAQAAAAAGAGLA